ncbi:MAG: hypothetical protein IPJ20_13565 [Flammeovirgaceae bacterium]|nr:hypothetical protein [Flammeovirgaceae bacterium]
MKKELIRKSLETGELQLTPSQKEGHYAIVIALLIIPTVFLFFLIKNLITNDSDKIKPELLIIGIIACGLGFLVYRLQKKRLRFVRVDTKLDRDQLNRIIELTGEELKWMPFYVDDQIIIAKTFPGFWSGSWGEQITIMFDNGRILMNSICDPDKKSSVFSNGRNTKNINLLVERVKAASR